MLLADLLPDCNDDALPAERIMTRNLDEAERELVRGLRLIASALSL
jgi:hypothetical protein